MRGQRRFRSGVFSRRIRTRAHLTKEVTIKRTTRFHVLAPLKTLESDVDLDHHGAVVRERAVIEQHVNLLQRQRRPDLSVSLKYQRGDIHKRKPGVFSLSLSLTHSLTHTLSLCEQKQDAAPPTRHLLLNSSSIASSPVEEGFVRRSRMDSMGTESARGEPCA